MKFTINNRTYEVYQLSNENLIDLINGDTITEEERTYLIDKALNRFKLSCCKNGGETSNDVFARSFSEYVNGGKECEKMLDREIGKNVIVDGYKALAQKLGKDHRYLQQEMFKVCIEYIKVLAEHANNHRFDPRNEWACKLSKQIVDFCETNRVYI